MQELWSIIVLLAILVRFDSELPVAGFCERRNQGPSPENPQLSKVLSVKSEASQSIALRASSAARNSALLCNICLLSDSFSQSSSSTPYSDV